MFSSVVYNSAQFEPSVQLPQMAAKYRLSDILSENESGTTQHRRSMQILTQTNGSLCFLSGKSVIW